MVQGFGNAFGAKPSHKSTVVIPHLPTRLVAPVRKPAAPAQMYSRVFRWHPPKGHAPAPATVEIVGGFTHWQKVPLHHDNAQGAWQVTLQNLHCGRMYHYMLLVDGQPVRDRHCDGLAVPHGPQEEQYQLKTERGPRVFMLFAQTK
jgi:hypothetical protein